MSYSDPSPRKPIPSGILVAKRSTASPPEKPAPKRKESDARQLPWLYIAVGGSVAWGIAILTIALCARSQGSQPAQQPPLALNRPNALPQAGQPAPFVAPDMDEFGIGAKEPKAGDAAPKLVRHLAPRNDDVPPELKVFPEDVIPAPAPGPVEAIKKEVNLNVKPAVAPAPVPDKAFKKDINLEVFANCDQIGTNVLFVKDPPQAFKMAFDKKKLVFVVHLSGNLEDKDFT